MVHVVRVEIALGEKTLIVSVIRIIMVYAGSSAVSSPERRCQRRGTSATVARPKASLITEGTEVIVGSVVVKDGEGDLTIRSLVIPRTGTVRR